MAAPLARKLLLVLAALLAACGDDPLAGPAAAPDDARSPVGSGDQECGHEVYDGDHMLAVLDSDGRFDHLLCVIESGPAAVRYFTTGNRRLFAPTDDVFARLGDEALSDLVTGDRAAQGRFQVALRIDGRSVKARALLDHHILGCSPNVAAASCPPAPDEEELRSGRYRNAAGATVEVRAQPGETHAGGATVLDQLEASNGVVYVVDDFVSLP